MDIDLPFINNDNKDKEENQYPKAHELNAAPNYKINENPSDLFLAQQIPQNNSSAPPQGQNIIPPDDLQYQNLSNFPQNENNQLENKIEQPEIDYSKYNNINQLPHRGIKQINNNIFYVSYKCCARLTPFTTILIGFVLSSTIFWTKVQAPNIVGTVVGSAIVILGIYLFFTFYYAFYFQINPNNISVKRVALCCCKQTYIILGK